VVDISEPSLSSFDISVFWWSWILVSGVGHSGEDIYICDVAHDHTGKLNFSANFSAFPMWIHSETHKHKCLYCKPELTEAYCITSI
jgi:hypothetical protein